MGIVYNLRKRDEDCVQPTQTWWGLCITYVNVMGIGYNLRKSDWECV